MPLLLCRQWDDETGEPTRLAGFDMYQPTAYNQGKIKVSNNLLIFKTDLSTIQDAQREFPYKQRAKAQLCSPEKDAIAAIREMNPYRNVVMI
eukprot:708661-Pelagomonas_calceolata.AAC.1